MTPPRLLILSFTDARHDPRVFRQASYLRENYAITLAGLADPRLDGVEFLSIRRRPKTVLSQGWIALNLLLGNAGFASRRFAPADSTAAGAKNFDLVLVNDAEPLPLAFDLAKGKPVVFDAHEYYPREFESSLRWRLLFRNYLTRLCAEYIPRCAAMTTVCGGIAREYEKEFGVLPEVILNGPKYHDLPALPCRNGAIRLIHHGAASPDRKLEQLIEMAAYLDERFTLTLMLTGDARYICRLKKLSGANPKIIWRDPAPMQDIPQEINSYDLGVYLAPPTNFNTRFMLPNKFFEFIQARLGVAIGPSPEMRHLAEKHQIGVVAEDFAPQSLAAKLNSLANEDICVFKRNADKAAKELTAEANMQRLADILLRVLENLQ